MENEEKQQAGNLFGVFLVLKMHFKAFLWISLKTIFNQ